MIYFLKIVKTYQMPNGPESKELSTNFVHRCEHFLRGKVAQYR